MNQNLEKRKLKKIIKKNIVPKKKEKKKKKGIIDYSAESDILYTRIDNFWKLFKDKQMLTDLIR